MREETRAWLAPMEKAAIERGIDLRPLYRAASFPAAEWGTPLGDALAKMNDPEADIRTGAIDWIRFGELLRHELGWDNTYPPEPGMN